MSSPTNRPITPLPLAVLDYCATAGLGTVQAIQELKGGNVPETFFAAYQEVHPLEPGWWDRLELLYLREILSVIAHFGNQYNSLEKLRAVVARFL